jgi:hypothetical protein
MKLLVMVLAILNISFKANAKVDKSELRVAVEETHESILQIEKSLYDEKIEQTDYTTIKGIAKDTSSRIKRIERTFTSNNIFFDLKSFFEKNNIEMNIKFYQTQSQKVAKARFAQILNVCFKNILKVFPNAKFKFSTVYFGSVSSGAREVQSNGYYAVVNSDMIGYLPSSGNVLVLTARSTVDTCVDVVAGSGIDL